MYKPRLYMYQIGLGSYDLIDKYNFSKLIFSKIKKIKFSFTIKKIINSNLSKILVQEFLTQNNFSLQLNSNNYILTLRNYKLYNFLEFLFNTIFLRNNQNLIVNKSNFNIDLIITLIFLDEFFFHLPLSIIPNKIIYTLNFENKNMDLKKFLSYYFII